MRCARESLLTAGGYPAEHAAVARIDAVVTPASLGRSYQRLWSANALSAIGTGMTTAALPLLASIEPPSELVLGFIAAAGLLPGVVLALPAGLLADRYDRGRLLVTADLVRAGVVIAAAIALMVGSLPGLVLAVITFLIGAGETIFVTASQSAIPTFVGPDDLDNANGRLQVADDVGREFVGPPLGSLLFRLATWVPFVGDAISYLVSAALLAGLPRTRAKEPTALQQRPTMRPAWQYFRSTRALVVLAGAMLTLSLCGSAVLAMLVLLVERQFHLDGGWFGPALTVIACGATLAGVVAGRLRSRFSARAAMSTSVAINAASYAVLGTSGLWPVAAVALFAWGFAVTFGNITSIGIRQRLIPSDLIGRVMGIFRWALSAGGVIGALGGGLLARTTSVGTVALAAGALQLPVVAALRFGLPPDAGVGQSPTGADRTS
jgi:MFS family permease